MPCSIASSMNLGVATPSSRPCCAEAAEVPQRMIDRLLADGVADRIADRLLDGPEVERLAARVIDSRLLDTIVERLLESEELWRLVDEIACSPAVTDAIGQQGVGFADQDVGQVRVPVAACGSPRGAAGAPAAAAQAPAIRCRPRRLTMTLGDVRERSHGAPGAADDGVFTRRAPTRRRRCAPRLRRLSARTAPEANYSPARLRRARHPGDRVHRRRGHRLRTGVLVGVVVGLALSVLGTPDEVDKAPVRPRGF
jgi:hypothetical protein